MYRLGGIVPLALGLGWAAYALLSFPLGSLTEPGPALWPVLVSAFIIVTSVILLFTERTSAEYEPFTKRSALVALGVVSTGIFIVLFQVVGFIIAAFLLMTYWARYLGQESWRLSLVVSAAVAVVFYAIFGPLLGVPLPLGVFS